MPCMQMKQDVFHEVVGVRYVVVVVHDVETTCKSVTRNNEQKRHFASFPYLSRNASKSTRTAGQAAAKDFMLFAESL